MNVLFLETFVINCILFETNSADLAKVYTNKLII